MSYWSEVVSPSSRSFGSTPRHLLAIERDKAAKAAVDLEKSFNDNKLEKRDPEITRVKENGE